jgi:hypothetical protein
VLAVIASGACTGPIPSPTQPSITVEPSAPPAPVVVFAQAPTSFDPVPIFISPDTGTHQGYATDGTSHYSIGTLDLSRKDAGWSNVTTNTTPFDGLSGFNHLGDGDYYDGILFLPAETYTSCDSFSNQGIFLFNSHDLSRLVSTPIAPERHEVSGIAVDGTSGVMYVSSYCDGLRIFKYDLFSHTYIGSLELSQNVPLIQGVAFKSGWLYAASDGLTKAIFAIDVQSGQVERVLTVNFGPGAYEGVDYSQAELRWLIDLGPGRQKVYYFKPTSDGRSPSFSSTSRPQPSDGGHFSWPLND